MNINKTNLNDTENLIMNTIWKYIEQNEKVNVVKIAEECFVSKATVIKLSKKLGYSGYSEMYYMMLASKKNQYSPEVFEISSLEKDGSNSQYIPNVAELLHYYRNDKILVDSLGYVDAARDYIIQKLLVFNFNANFCYHYEAFANTTFKKGLFIVMSNSGARGEILERIREAKENGFNVLVFSSDLNSPAGKLAHTSIQIDSIKSTKNHYKADFFTAKIIVFFEMVLEEYSKTFLEKPNEK
ncbi:MULTISPECIES: hypothetical protein [unclassified Breznakia]|uniref:MurR/RpiR family transcriptional regulator n=1 Tax=unclassified Breznakia TaxID=2623764 RepID=UPI002473C2D4|nr:MULTISPECIES: hypothetical protein [unclassified Breznakia]MDH6368169.1 DNA-binding MurR/RpiR family transcriptional regulator [Breznakia sp. PH1-1]MDH6405258.1 DNA-binding MurR/RpiR family transcriptional regulator [Breznakia sp. PF1-11]MDH6412972.1 DNA-binding MurR/RpiR family transcriptional regulator [Breznakia sp. PFB1-11]MDH6415334.1 DNA-binding MurR/RpiR family transcriptional regulator [Breznakia sp. PFB1-14]MDH6417638.1 DNA-binding MurR/RpiR family transcriptional regulator [Brezna